MISTIVEIIRAYQPSSRQASILISTIVEIIRAYQPIISWLLGIGIYNSRNYQSLLATSRDEVQRHEIYNSRNYQSLLAMDSNRRNTLKSTIVEIIRAYQPTLYRQRVIHIYNSRNYQSLLALVSGKRLQTYLQQQKLLELTSLKIKNSHYTISTIVEIIRAYQPSICFC